MGENIDDFRKIKTVEGTGTRERIRSVILHVKIIADSHFRKLNSFTYLIQTIMFLQI